MSATVRIRDLLLQSVPWWLSDRHYSNGKTAGIRLLWSLVEPLDSFLEYIVQGLQAAWPGVGTATALALIGRTRGIIRGETDTDAEYVAKLGKWLEKWRNAGTQSQLAIEIHEYLGNHPRVRVVNRAGHMVTCEADGTITTADVAWDWDSVSHPARASYWSDLWVIVYSPQWPVETGTWGDGTLWGDDGTLGIGHDVPREPVDALRGLVAQWRSAHSRVRALIWTTDDTQFDPDDPGSMPNGEWGAWGTTGSGSRGPSDRDLTSCRYWEFL